MTYQQQPGWSDPSWPSSQPYVDPMQPTSPAAYPGSPVHPASPAGYPAQQAYAPQQQYAQQAAYPSYGYPAAAPATNGLAIASLVLSLVGLVTCGVTSLIGAILGHVARRQIAERGEGGDGLALAGVISGWIILGLFVVGGGLYFVLIAAVIAAAPTGATYELFRTVLSALYP